MQGLTDHAFEQIAQYFQALAEPSRLRILNLLRDGERNVGDIATACNSTAANVSRHLSVLAKHGFVAREARGTSVYYRIADPNIDALCDLACNRIAGHLNARAADFR